MADFPFQIVGDATSADKAIDGVLDGLDDIRKKAASASQTLSRELVGAANQFEDAIEDAAKSSAKAFDTIGLGAQNQLTRIQRFNSGFQGLTGRIGAGIGAIDNFAKGLAPWNQALELAGKVVRFANEGLDAYAKTSAEAASEVAKLKKEFQGYSDAVMSTAGHVTTEILKQAMSFDEVRKQLIRVENTDVYKRLYGGQSISVFEGTDEGNSAFANLTSGLGKIKDAARDTFKGDAWNTGAVDDALGRVREKLDKTRESARKAADEMAKYRAEIAALRALEGRNMTDNRSLPGFAAPFPTPVNYTAGLNSDPHEVGGTHQSITEQADRNIDARADEIMRANGKIIEVSDEQKKAAAEVKEAWAQGLGSVAADFVNMAATGEMSLERLGTSLAKLALQIAAMQIGGPWGAFLGSFAGGLSLPGHATGTQFMVGGRGGSDQNIVAFRASGNERVTVETPEDVRSGRYMGGGRGATQIVVQSDPREVVSALGSRAAEREVVRLNRKFRRN